MLQESGLYQYETQKSTTPNGFGREIDRRIPVEYRPEPIVFDEIKGVLFLFLIRMGSTFAVISEMARLRRSRGGIGVGKMADCHGGVFRHFL